MGEEGSGELESWGVEEMEKWRVGDLEKGGCGEMCKCADVGERCADVGIDGEMCRCVDVGKCANVQISRRGEVRIRRSIVLDLEKFNEVSRCPVGTKAR